MGPLRFASVDVEVVIVADRIVQAKVEGTKLSFTLNKIHERAARSGLRRVALNVSAL